MINTSMYDELLEFVIKEVNPTVDRVSIHWCANPDIVPATSVIVNYKDGTEYMIDTYGRSLEDLILLTVHEAAVRLPIPTKVAKHAVKGIRIND